MNQTTQQQYDEALNMALSRLEQYDGEYYSDVEDNVLTLSWHDPVLGIEHYHFMLINVRSLPVLTVNEELAEMKEWLNVIKQKQEVLAKLSEEDISILKLSGF